MRERRAWPRLPLALPVFVRGTDQEGKEFLEFTTALNVSAGGMLVGLRRNLRRSARVLLEVPSAPSAETFSPLQPRAAREQHTLGTPEPTRNLQARLVRVSEGPGWKLYGFRFTRPLGTVKKGKSIP